MSYVSPDHKENLAAQRRPVDDTWMIYHSKAEIKCTWMHQFRSSSQICRSRYTERNRLWNHGKWQSMARKHTFSLVAESGLIHSYCPFVHRRGAYSCVSWNIHIWRMLRYMHATFKIRGNPSMWAEMISCARKRRSDSFPNISCGWHVRILSHAIHH
jgi:hypothetical protein